MARSYGEQYRPIFESALEEEIGVYIETDNIKVLSPVLYELKKTDPAFEELIILQPTIEGKDGVLFIAKKTTEMVD